MSFGIIRVRELRSTTDVANSEIHNGRQYDSYGLETPKNIKPQESKYPNFVHEISDKYSNCNTVNDAIQERFKETGVKVRKDSVIGLEYVVSLSPDAMKKINDNDYSIRTVLDLLGQFVRDKHGSDNIISVSKHYDESNPHAHVIVTPILEKEVKWKNRNGEGIKKENRLSARDFTGNKGLLRQLQTDYYNYITTPKTKGFYLDLKERFDIDMYRGVPAEKQLKTYTKNTIAEIGHLRAQISNVNVNLTMSIIMSQTNLEIAEKNVRDANRTVEKIIKEQIRQEELAAKLAATEQEFIDTSNELHKKIEHEQHFKNENNKDGKWKDNAGMKIDF